MTEQADLESRVTAARNGDTVALATLLATYDPRLRARVAAHLDPALRARISPDDILQEVYVQVFQQIDRFEYRGPASFLNWVLTILDRRLVDARRAARRRVRDVGREVQVQGAADDSYWNLLDEVYAESETPSRVARREEALGALLSCLSALPDTHREVVQMRFLEGRSVGEVAQRLGKTEAAITVLCHRAVKALRGSMDRLGEFTRGG
jgi:RNA polymerase sigma-70 factor, ECF subfamily